VQPIALTHHVLDNGLRVVMAPDPRVSVVGVNVSYRVGSAHEEPGRTGFAHLFEHMMFQGSANVGKAEHFRLVQAAGGRANAYTERDATVYYETLPSHQLELALWLEADRMGSLAAALSQSTLDNQRDVVKNERRRNVDNAPYGTWEERITALAYPPQHPYHHPALGSMEDLSAASLDDVRSFFSTWYVPNNAVLTIVGDVTPEPALAMIERHFGPIRRSDRLPAQPDGPPLEEGAGAATEEVAEPVPSARLIVGYRVPPFGAPAFALSEVIADLLAGGRASRLHDDLVRDRQLAAEVSAGVFRFVVGEALLIVDVTGHSGVEPRRIGERVQAAVEALGLEGPRPDDLDRVRNLHRTQLAAELERAGERADLIATHACLLGDAEGVNRELSDYVAVGADEIREFAARYLVTGRQSVLAFVPSE
jgi:zinc protease